ncbi:MAG: glycoside hydrolase family 3 N-terminal domain-containing protein [Wenzhouxiangellaceae bacterium]|nr:glycoside hydrolase family 3 N-terminal domain-containing protein [Wenzhouxiangellaceae bacterium]
MTAQQPCTTASTRQPTSRRVLPAIALLVTLAGGLIGAQAASPEGTWGPARPETLDAGLEARIDALMARMSLEQKIGQIIQAEIQHVTPDEIQRYGLGSVLNGGGSFPELDRRAPIAKWTELATALHEAARRPMAEGLPAIPLLWGTDAVHGHNNVHGATIFPHNIALGATRNAELVRAIARATAEDVAATGIDWNFAPTLAVSRDLRWGRAYESFSSDPQLVTELGRAAVLGLQGEPGAADWLGPRRVIATAKHFVGDGGTFMGIDQGDTRVDEAELAAIHGLPYPATIDAGVQTVMASFSSWNGTKLHGHRYLLTEVLKDHLGFDGFVIGDWNGHGQIPGCTVSDCVAALEAGVDMFMVPENWREFRTTMLDHARNGRLSLARLDDAVRRILRVKHRAGLFDAATHETRIRSTIDDHSELARRAVRESLVLLKNNGGVLPLNPSARIAVVGDGADDIGKQSGGWTLDWQGVTGTNESFPNGESIGAGIAAQVRASGGQVHLGENGLSEFKPDVVIAIYGEDPYAEGHGDLESLEYQAGTREDLDLLDRLAALDAPVVSVFLSGRPLWVNPHLNRSDAFVAAWLPGTAGGGIADVLLAGADGNARHTPSGRLPFAWPAEPLPADDGSFEALFDFGFGLAFGDPSSLDRLPETDMAPRAVSFVEQDNPVLFDGNAQAPWRLVLRDASSQHTIPAEGQIASTTGEQPLVVTPTDRRLQGDARRVNWSGSLGDRVALVSREPLDLTALVARGGQLVFETRIESGAPTPVELVVECGGADCPVTLPMSALVADTHNNWQTVRLPLACLGARGVDLSAISSLFSLRSATPAAVSFGAVRIEFGNAPDTGSAVCPD